MSELYCEEVIHEYESAVWGDVEKSIKGSVRAEARGVKNVRQNRVSSDTPQRTSPNWLNLP